MRENLGRSNVLPERSIAPRLVSLLFLDEGTAPNSSFDHPKTARLIYKNRSRPKSRSVRGFALVALFPYPQKRKTRVIIP